MHGVASVQVRAPQEGEGCTSGDLELFRSGDTGPTLPGGMVLARDAHADLAVYPPRHEDGEPGPRRQMPQAVIGAPVIDFCAVEQPAAGLPQDVLHLRVRVDNLLRRHRPDPGFRKIAMTTPGVLVHVPGDVGQLHGDAEVDRERTSLRCLHVDHVAHHEPDNSRHMIGVAYQFSLGFHCDDAEV